MRFGGGGHRRVEDLEATSRANGGSLLSAGPDSEVGLYHRVVALMVDQGFAAARHRALQADPLRASDEARPVPMPDGTTPTLSPLERWERILGLRPAKDATVTQRREAVAARRALTGRSTLGEINGILARIFGDWPVTVYTKRAADLTATDAYWPLGANTPAYPGSAPTGTLTWYSEVCAFFFTVVAPSNAGDADKARRMSQANAAIDDTCPAHAYTFGSYT